MSNGKGSIILQTIISVATLLVAVAGATFAYFSATINGNESPTTIEVTSGKIFVEYHDSSTIKGNMVAEGETLATNNFSVVGYVTGSSNLNYEAKLNVLNNTYESGELVYTITSTNASKNGTIIQTTSKPVIIPKGKSTIKLGTGLFAGPTTTGAHHEYTIKISRVSAVANDVNKDFSATISVN